MAFMGAAAYVMVRAHARSSTFFADAVRTECLARAGVEDSIARLRQAAFLDTEEPTANWYTTDWLRGGARRPSFGYGDGQDNDRDGIVDNEPGEKKQPYSRALGSSVCLSSDRYMLEVEDAASKINLNACDNLAVVLDNLCRLLGPPLVAADEDLIQPYRWFEEDKLSADQAQRFGANTEDTAQKRDLYFELDAHRRPLQRNQPPYADRLRALGKPLDGTAVFGDGYAIAGFRSRSGPLSTVEDIKRALTYCERNNNHRPDDPLELLQIEAKYEALRPYVTLHSWVDTQTVCVGKFEWVTEGTVKAVQHPVNRQQIEGDVYCQVLIDRDKSWVADDPVNDPQNRRGSLRGSYVSIMNGHGSGQLRRIAANGADWIGIRQEEQMVIPPGPISSYMIIAREDALLEAVPNTQPPVYLPQTKPDGSLVDDPDIDYARYPLCIHRAPVNVNTAAPVVLAALLMGINVQHGHPMAVGTDADAHKISKDLLPTLYSAGPPCKLTNAAATDWKAKDNVLQLYPYLLTPRGLKRVPADSGKLVFDRDLNALLAKYRLGPPDYDLSYLASGRQPSRLNEAEELALRIAVARQRSKPPGERDPDPFTAYCDGGPFERGPFRSYDDLFFRVVRPWDEARLEEDEADGRHNRISVARLILALVNSNTDILKFNPNIEWIDRWGRNFTEMEPVMVFRGNGPDWTPDSYACAKCPPGTKGAYFVRTLRYRSDEMIDKTDLNRSSTELCFDASGIYQITAVGQVQGWQGLVAERKASALVKVYDVWRESTQRQFVRGTISNADRQNRNRIGSATSSGYTDAGRITRDRDNDRASSAALRYKALDTLPEPLAPLNYRLNNAGSGKCDELVDSTIRDAWRRPKNRTLPDVLANRVLPANYDGQIVLATNTSGYQPYPAADMDTFLASFNGELDTDTAAGNGREQSKTPRSAAVRAVDTFGLLGLLNDTEVDYDPDAYEIFVVALASNTSIGKLIDLQAPQWGFPDPVVGRQTRAGECYWNNLSVRMGDLRPEGVFLGAPGTSAKDAILKYPFDTLPARLSRSGAGTPSPPTKNYYPGSPDGCTLSLWFKPTWHATDSHEHEFFNGNTIGDTSGNYARYNVLYKSGYFSFAKRETAGASHIGDRTNCFHFGTEDISDNDIFMYIHGGTTDVDPPYLPGGGRSQGVETPAYWIQPFRWSFAGAAWHYNRKTTTRGLVMGGRYGIWMVGGPTHPWPLELVSNVARPVVSTSRHSEGPQWSSGYYNTHDGFYWAMKWDDQELLSPDLTGQPAAYPRLGPASGGATVDHPNSRHLEGCFSINNVNLSPNEWIYRATPLDGTHAVIDELKLSRRQWTSERIAAEMTLSRYYLPAQPGYDGNCPTFTSQTLWESLRGLGIASQEPVCPVRVQWNVFTPRFMHEYKTQGAFRRNELINGVLTPNVAFRGPFDYAQYNRDVGYDAGCGWKHDAVNKPRKWYSAERPPPEAGRQAHYSKGIEVELLAADSKIPGHAWVEGKWVPTSTFTNPDAPNRLGSSLTPASVPAARLQYRLRFRYPIEPNVDPAGGATVNPNTHYMLDTPVFDDISITYFARTRVLWRKEMTD